MRIVNSRTGVRADVPEDVFAKLDKEWKPEKAPARKPSAAKAAAEDE